MQLLCKCIEFLFAHDAGFPYRAHDSPLVSYGLYDITSASLAFGTDERGPLGYAPKGLAEVARTADEGDFERVLVNVMFLVSRSEHLRLVDVVNSNGLQDLVIGR